MKKSRFSEQQIINILKQADAGVKVQDLCRQHDISNATYYKWKSKYGGMEASDIKRLREIEAEVNESWSLDFMQDSLSSGKRFRTLNVIDEGVRECLAIEVDTSLRAERVVRVLEFLKDWRGVPRLIRLDNGPELTSVKLQAWCESNGVKLKFIQPGKPNQNAFIERFNRTFRSEVLNAYIFETLEEVREVVWWWMVAYNEERPHDALGGVPPSIYRKRLSAETSTFGL